MDATPRRRKTSAERRAQRQRAELRRAQWLHTALVNLASHRGSKVGKVLADFARSSVEFRSEDELNEKEGAAMACPVPLTPPAGPVEGCGLVDEHGPSPAVASNGVVATRHSGREEVRAPVEVRIVRPAEGRLHEGMEAHERTPVAVPVPAPAVERVPVEVDVPAGRRVRVEERVPHASGKGRNLVQGLAPVATRTPAAWPAPAAGRLPSLVAEITRGRARVAHVDDAVAAHVGDALHVIHEAVEHQGAVLAAGPVMSADEPARRAVNAKSAPTSSSAASTTGAAREVRTRVRAAPAAAHKREVTKVVATAASRGLPDLNTEMVINVVVEALTFHNLHITELKMVLDIADGTAACSRDGRGLMVLREAKSLLLALAQGQLSAAELAAAQVSVERGYYGL
jgi:hypothetical protein